MPVQIGSKQITCGKLKLSIMYTHLGCNDVFSTNTLLILGDCVKKCHQNTETVRDQTHCSLPKKLLNQHLFCAWLTKSDHWIRSWERKLRGAWLRLKVGSRFSHYAEIETENDIAQDHLISTENTSAEPSEVWAICVFTFYHKIA